MSTGLGDELPRGTNEEALNGVALNGSENKRGQAEELR